MTSRYFVESPIEGSEAVLAGPEAHHLAHVMRGRPGDSILLFDGSGSEFSATVEQIGRAEIRLKIVERHEVDRELAVACTLAVALPKGDRQGWLVEKAVELGARRLVPLETTRGVAQPVEKALARLRRTVIEASKQCGRNRLLEICEPQTWSDFVALQSEVSSRFVAHPGVIGQWADCSIRIGQWPAVAPKIEPNAACVFAVGPEGGFTDEEIQLALGAGWRTIDLGSRILRIETAALLLCGLVATIGKSTDAP